jgi:hypothetical protein
MSESISVESNGAWLPALVYQLNAAEWIWQTAPKLDSINFDSTGLE